jgi:DNA-binding transcriptional MerR regulator
MPLYAEGSKSCVHAGNLALPPVELVPARENAAHHRIHGDILTSSALEVGQSGMAGPMNIQEFSRITGMSSHTLRYYERAGLMPRVERNASGHRRYSERHELWVGFLRHLRMAGMSIATIRRYVVLLDQGRTGDAQRMALLREHRDDLAGRLEQLKRHLVVINQKLRDGCGPDVERARHRRGDRGATRRSP